MLVLDSLEDPQNVGTLLRTAEAAGVHGVIFPTRRSAPLSPAAIKASAGATEHLLLVPLDDLPAGLVDLHTRGLRIVGADGDAPLTVRELDLRGPLALVVGSEGRGLDARVRRRVDAMARIPMRGRVGSLNAAVAGSVFLFEAAAQRGLPEAAPAGGRRPRSLSRRSRRDAWTSRRPTTPAPARRRRDADRRRRAASREAAATLPDCWQPTCAAARRAGTDDVARASARRTACAEAARRSTDLRPTAARGLGLHACERWPLLRYHHSSPPT